MKHTVFGAVQGDADQEIVNAIEQGDTIDSVSISGDTAVIKEQAKEDLVAWNDILDEGFPNLKPAS